MPTAFKILLLSYKLYFGNCYALLEAMNSKLFISKSSNETSRKRSNANSFDAEAILNANYFLNEVVTVFVTGEKAGQESASINSGEGFYCSVSIIS